MKEGKNMNENRFYWKGEPGLWPAIDDPFNIGPEQLPVPENLLEGVDSDDDVHIIYIDD